MAPKTMSKVHEKHKPVQVCSEVSVQWDVLSQERVWVMAALEPNPMHVYAHLIIAKGAYAQVGSNRTAA